MTAPTLWDFVPPAPAVSLVDQLTAIALELATMAGARGVTVGEIVYEAERRGIAVGGAVMSDKTKEQRQTSWLARVPRAAGLLATDRVRQSPVKRHHRHRHTVYLAPEFAQAGAA